jgi:hypothetical protein
LGVVQAAAGDLLLIAERLVGHRGPEEARKFAGDGGGRDGRALAVAGEVAVAMVQAELRLPGARRDRGRDVLCERSRAWRVLRGRGPVVAPQGAPFDRLKRDARRRGGSRRRRRARGRVFTFQRDAGVDDQRRDASRKLAGVKWTRVTQPLTRARRTRQVAPSRA